MVSEGNSWENRAQMKESILLKHPMLITHLRNASIQAVCVHEHPHHLALAFINLPEEHEYFAHLPFLWHDTPYKEKIWSKISNVCRDTKLNMD